MSLFVRRLQPGDVFRARTDHEEAAFVLLGGACQVDWGQGPTRIGKRKNVFDGLPYALYLPSGNQAVFTAETVCELAECRAPSEARLQPKLITPSDVVSSLRGGGNASRQIVDIITPAFPADKLMVIEVYTPGGNWSSWPPHKHDLHNPPGEVDLDEIYYYRLRQPDGFAMQHLYSGKHGADQTLKVKDGDTVLVHSGRQEGGGPPAVLAGAPPLSRLAGLISPFWVLDGLRQWLGGTTVTELPNPGGYGPLYQLSYMMGGLQLRALHKEVMDSGKMTERQFNDAVLREGRVPIAMLRAALTSQKLTRLYFGSRNSSTSALKLPRVVSGFWIVPLAKASIMPFLKSCPPG